MIATSDGRVRKRSISIRGHRTSFSLEQPFLDELAAIASASGMTVSALVAEVDAERPRETNLSSALRLRVLEWLKSRQASD
jgi:predicted DNA-binding ribbon-helix-helix protein